MALSELQIDSSPSSSTDQRLGAYTLTPPTPDLSFCQEALRPPASRVITDLKQDLPGATAHGYFSALEAAFGTTQSGEELLIQYHCVKRKEGMQKMIHQDIFPFENGTEVRKGAGDQVAAAKVAKPFTKETGAALANSVSSTSPDEPHQSVVPLTKEEEKLTDRLLKLEGTDETFETMALMVPNGSDSARCPLIVGTNTGIFKQCYAECKIEGGRR
ncbi:hypothetical protein HOLleu_29019 [Holothuria leucospilota]|uniref:Uncharacterized protein n=1 Tax=Holothuria leucospilota TaxID=206669 RepID=A0A9Q1BN92_HOLLE|nr:hypothetical protein HOLleu_29019 [Holothuria leucospilota]